VGNKIADKICKMREEGVQFNWDRLANIPYLVISPELFIFTFAILSIIKSKQCISNNKIF
jgi:hypothetical protein